MFGRFIMEAKKAPPEDLLLIKRVVEGQIIPEIRDGDYLGAQIATGNILGAIDHSRVRMEHCGIILISSLQALSNVLEKGEHNLVEGLLKRVRAYLAQSLMYH